MRLQRESIIAGGILLAIVGLVVALRFHERRDPAHSSGPIGPPVNELLDVNKIGHVPIRPEDNAFELYRQASQQFSPMSEAAQAQYGDYCTDKGSNGGWQTIGADLRKWLESNAQTLELLRKGSDRDEAVYCQPSAQTIADDMQVVKNLHEMRTLVELEVLRLESIGDFGGAWSWCRALLRASRHSGLHGETGERLVGTRLHATAIRSVLRWAAFPEVTTAMLRVALRECRLIYKQTVPASGPLSVEYLIWMKLLGDQNGAEAIEAAANILTRKNEPFDRSEEPQASIAVLPLVYTNWVNECDRPRHERHPRLTGQLSLFQTEPEDGSTTHEIELRLRTAFVVRTLGPDVFAFLDALDRELAKQRLTEIALLSQIRLRESGSLPATLDELLGEDLDEIPFDPFGRGDRLRYRRNWTHSKTATIWSVGSDEKDDDGLIDIATNDRLTGDVIVYVGTIEDLESPNSR